MALKVKNINTNVVCEAVKNEDSTYTVEGKTLSREDMAKSYRAVKEEVKKPEIKAELEIVENSWQSEDLGNIALALSKAQGEFLSVSKSTEAYNYKYATLADTIEMVRPILSKHEIALTQLTVSKMYGDILLSGIKSMLIHSSGEWISSECYLPATATKSNNIAQVQGSWGSYIRRYSIMSMLNLATEDKDGVV